MPPVDPLKLLVVDDHTAFRRTVRQLFEGTMMQIHEASSGEEAVELYAQVRPAWVVMDLRMPGMGGLKATEAIRKLDAQARVIVISQLNELEYLEQAHGAGAVGFVSKEEVYRLAEIIQPPSPT